MTTTAAQATIKTVEQSLYLVSIDRNGNQRVEFVGTREYGEALMAWRNAQANR